MPSEFFTDVATLRERARQHIERGAVTKSPPSFSRASSWRRPTRSARSFWASSAPDIVLGMRGVSSEIETIENN